MNCSSEVAAEFGVAALPLVYAQGGWSAATWKEDATTGDPNAVVRRNTVRELLSKAVPTAGLRRLLFPPPGRDGIWKGPRWVIGQSQRLAERFTRPRIVPGRGDALVILDPWWRCPASYWRSVGQARRRGALVGTVIYDLIPITHPDFVGQRHRERFRRWLHRAADHTDFFLAISETVKRELRSHLLEFYSTQSWPEQQFRSFTLGADLPANARGEVRNVLHRVFDGGNTYLMVGALEPRKNHRFLLDAFEKLWQRGLDVRLCFVGSHTKAIPEFRQRLAQHPEQGRRLFYFADLSDVELGYCYQRARALIYPSIVEGFGLPIVEALQHGKLVVASDTPIHREVGGEFCAFFDLSCTDSLVETTVRLEQIGQLAGVRPATDYVAPTWKDSCHALIKHCHRHLDETNREHDRINRAA